MIKSRILLVTAHLDDFELGMGGTTIKLCEQHDVFLVVMCKGDRPGVTEVQNERKAACVKNCNEIGIKETIFYEYSDTFLDQVSQTELCGLLYDIINTIKPATVYTHNEYDVHMDHRILSNAMRVACRMRETSPVNKLYEFTVPGSTEWSHKPHAFNTYSDITEQFEQKMNMISRYETELRQSPDPISGPMIEARDAYHGSLSGYKVAEVFNLIFER